MWQGEIQRAKREGGHFLIPEPESSASSDLHDVPLGKGNIPPSGLAVNDWLRNDTLGSNKLRRKAHPTCRHWHRS